MNLKITMLGCGNSSGVPAAGNYWGACDPKEPKNKRSRASLLVQSKLTSLIIDTGADFREQMNRNNISILDAVLYTHHHGDHCHGIDDLRAMYFHNNFQKINVFGAQSTLDSIEKRFPYLFNGGENSELYPEILNSSSFDDMASGLPRKISDISFIPFAMDHGTCEATGYRFGEVTYCVDMKSLNDKALEIIRGSKIWIVDGAGYKNNHNAVHADLETIYRYNEYIQAQSVYITSLSTQMDYMTLAKELPDGFYPAYDGLSFYCLN